MIRLLKESDFESWMTLAREVEPLFGPMVQTKDFREAIMQCICSHNAYGVETEDGSLAGIVALDRKKNEISWLAVSQTYRGNGLGDKLIKKAVDELKNGGDIHVQTFSCGAVEGMGARIIYGRNGFSDYKDAGLNPAGIETVIMIRKNSK